MSRCTQSPEQPFPHLPSNSRIQCTSSNSVCRIHSCHLHPHKTPDTGIALSSILQMMKPIKNIKYLHTGFFFMVHITRKSFFLLCAFPTRPQKNDVCFIHRYTPGKHLVRAYYYSTNTFSSLLASIILFTTDKLACTHLRLTKPSAPQLLPREPNLISILVRKIILKYSSSKKENRSMVPPVG